MKFTLTWLKRYLDTSASAEQIVEALTSIGLEVEETLDKGAVYNSFIIAEIQEAIQHPEADKLRVCKVNNGKEILQVVCGASNARAGIKVVLAPIGTIIPANKMQIKASKIRGIESNGMLCAADELELDSASEGIMELSNEAIVGSKFADHANLNDVLIDVALTPNRGDAASVYGIARDLAAKGIGKLKLPPAINNAAKFKPNKQVKILASDGCYEFCMREVRNVNNQPKDGWYSKFLKSIGSSPKTPLVELSNFAMFDYGRPNHIYDADKLVGNLEVRRSQQGEKFVAIGGTEYELPAGLLVVADEQRVVCMAGVMGGELTKVDENTQNILIEVGNWDPIAVMESGRGLNLLSDSRFRFERRVDHANSQYFVEYLSKLIAEECGGELSEITAVKGTPLNYLESLNFDFHTIKRIAGIDIGEKRAKEILENLGFKLQGNEVVIPSYRQGDIQNAEDIAEEVLRIEGLENISSTPLTLDTKNLNKKLSLNTDNIRSGLIYRNLFELITWTFYGQNDAELFGTTDGLITLKNPISVDLSIMRQSILPNLIKAASANEARSIANTGFFEIGSIFNKKLASKQTSCVAGLRYGKINFKSVFDKQRDGDFYDAKADLFAAITAYGFDPQKLSITKEIPAYYHPGRSAAFWLGKNLIAYAGEIHPTIASTYEVTGKVVAFELFIDNLPIKKESANKKALTLTNYQPVTRDFAFILSKNIAVADVLKEIKQCSNLIEDVQVFDVFESEQLGENKSVAITIRIQPVEKTLEEKDILAISDMIVNNVNTKFDAKLRM